MKQFFFFLVIYIALSIFYVPNTYAYDRSTYANKELCGNFEVALFKEDGTIEQKSCHTNYDEANAKMIEDGNKDLVVLGKWDGVVKIFNANSALIDLTGISGTFDIYDSYQLNKAHTYMLGESGYGGVDAALISISYSTYANTFSAQMKINGYTGWVRLGIVEIVPLVWVKSSSSYTISDESIRHNYVVKIQNDYSGSSGNTIGPKPTMLEPGTYYSYDGHYFYKDRYQMISDYKNESFENSVNKDEPYYNYYQFLPQHTKTTYSSINIDEFIRNAMGLKQDVYGSKASANTSRLYGKGAFFYNAQELYGGNALLALGVSRNESANGRSNLSINKNNGFGLNAVDSNPTQAANWFATFSQSIYDYNNAWVTYGYSEPTDQRYFGAQNGNKYVGMNVKYASDVYWGEKMASNYYGLDKAYGLQDYNYYQTAVTTKKTVAYSSPSLTSKQVYSYKSSDVGLVLLEELEGEEVEGNNIWYKVVSDMNIDSNFNQLLSGYYNWDSHVYVPAAHIYKTNEGKNGYISPNDVPKHKDSTYTYDLHIENAILKPKVAQSVKDTNYYYDVTLTSKTNQILLNNRYVMVFTTAFDENKKPVAYLVTSDYKYDQKHWVNADSIKFVTANYGQANVTVPNQNLYTTVNPTTTDILSEHISGLYHYAYTPILEEKNVNGQLWYKVPVNLSGSSNIYGWTLASAENVLIEKFEYIAENKAPTITAVDQTIIQGQRFEALANVSAYDEEDGNLTSKIQITSDNIQETPGIYQVTYSVTDNGNTTSYKTISVTVIKDEEPIINAVDKVLSLNGSFDERKDVTANDKEDGNLTSSIKIIKNTVNTKELGTYEVTYQVTDSYNHIVEKTIKVIVTEKEKVQKSGRFDLSYFKIIDNKLSIKGYSTIDGIDHTLNIPIVYKLIIQNINDPTKKYEQSLSRITTPSNIPYNTPSIDGKDYKYSWFEGIIDISSYQAGDYKMYVETSSDNIYSKNIVNNQLFAEQIVSMVQHEKYLMTRNNYFDKDKPIEIIIRDEPLGEKTAPALSNQYGQLEEIKFTPLNKLYIYGNAFSSNANLSLTTNVERKIIFENQLTYEKYTYNIDSITTGKYTVKMPVDDNLSKEKAWYEKEIDISNLPLGKYSIYIETKSNISDIGELNEQLFRDLTKVSTKINNKVYTFGVNYNQRYRVELTVS